MKFVHHIMCTMCLGIEDWLELKSPIVYCVQKHLYHVVYL